MSVVYPPSPADAEVLHRLGFQDGVAYMPVPRCETCRWWEDRSWGGEGGVGACRLSAELGRRLFSVGDGQLLTSPSFGCVQWEERKP